LFCAITCFIFFFKFFISRILLFKDLIADNIRLRARVGVLEEAVATLEAKLAEATATTGLWQYLLAGMGAALVVELLARPVWVRCTGRQFPLDRVLDKVVSPVVERALAASHLAWARLLAATLYVLRRRRSETVEVGVDSILLLLIYILKLCLSES
jgi:hypothetical protein